MTMWQCRGVKRGELFYSIDRSASAWCQTAPKQPQTMGTEYIFHKADKVMKFINLAQAYQFPNYQNMTFG